MVSESGRTGSAPTVNGTREVAQAAPGFGRVLGGLPGPAGHHEQVGGRAEQDRDRVAARRPQAIEFAGGGIRGAGYFGHEQRRMRTDRGRDQHLVIAQRLPDVPELTAADGGP